MKPLLILCALLLATVAHGDDEGMIKIVYKTVGPEIAPDSFDAQPKTLYRWGNKSREEAPYDPALKVRALTISDGKNFWIINQDDHTGGHMMMPPEPHPFYPLMYLAAEGQPQRAADFSFGHELAYMTAHQAKPGKVTTNGVTSTVYETKQEGLTLTLIMLPGTQTPLGIQISDGDHRLACLCYIEYTKLKPDPMLFQVPAGVQISEVPQQ